MCVCVIHSQIKIHTDIPSRMLAAGLVLRIWRRLTKRWSQGWTSGRLHPRPLHVRVRMLARRQVCPCLKQAPGGGAWVPRLASRHHGPKARQPLSKHQVSTLKQLYVVKNKKKQFLRPFRKPLGNLSKCQFSKELLKWNPQVSSRKHERKGFLLAGYKTKSCTISLISVSRGPFMRGIPENCLL